MGKHNPCEGINIERLSAIYSNTTYTGNGSNRVGSTTVTLTFILSDGSTTDKTETFSGIKETTTGCFDYIICYWNVTVMITVTTTGSNNNMRITGATGEILYKVVIE